MEFKSPLAAAGWAVIKTVLDKNKRYGESVGKSADLLRILCPNGIMVNQYDDLHLVVRMLDKISRIMSGGVDIQSIRDSYADIAGYGIIGAATRKEKE